MNVGMKGLELILGGISINRSSCMEILSDYQYNEVGKRGTGKEMC